MSFQTDTNICMHTRANATFLGDSTTSVLLVMCFSPKSMQTYFSTLRNVWTDINTLVLNAKKCIYLHQFLHFSCFQPTPPPLIIGYFSVFGEHLSKGKKTQWRTTKSRVYFRDLRLPEVST